MTTQRDAPYAERIRPRTAFVTLNGLRHCVREWGDPTAPTVFMLHGWMDVSASFQFVVDALRSDWHVVAPDWRGFGQTQWVGPEAASYRMADLFADLDALLDRFQPRAGDGRAVDLVGHSLGGNVAWLYAGVRPARVRRVVSLDGFCGTPERADESPAQLAHWLDRLSEAPTLPLFASLDDVAARILVGSPSMPVARARYLAAHWSVPQADGRFALRSDPRHKRREPMRYPHDVLRALWRSATATVLHVEAGRSNALAKAAREFGPHAFREELDSLPGHRFARIAQAGHMLHHEAPEKLAAIVEDAIVTPRSTPRRR